ncbi:hypothetical protein [Kitasatospora purpeofusca]|uniref:hypothetical protein n=1 Tax=Kitasatospora purpeofusca TaxID=67352 RepID=UPI002257DFB0|nr:hypothetical protein [Kitasatospora purpeofusca]MCX4752882.1 hypothetical protein [Kitasatospora purpeofusca]WSR32426.1 hypothetical protein OG715_16420 [Kitasatospora purpeofusca]WSR40513.1 hypothetical protein OG196_16200 [Kitasatospora purpeofusca]
MVELTCPSCQTPLDQAEAEANDAALEVGREDGARFFPDPVICMTGTLTEPVAILYGMDHLERILRTGQAEGIGVIDRLPEDTRCEPTAGGVLIY